MVQKSNLKPPKDDLVTVRSDLGLLDHEDGRCGSGTSFQVEDHVLSDPESQVSGDQKPTSRWRTGANNFVKIVSLVVLLYLFICSLNLLAASFRLIGGKTASAIFHESELLENPVVGLMIGVLVTVLVQSSSTSSSIIVSMVAAGILKVRIAIPFIMGANIGTSVTNTLVSFGQVTDRIQFERAFAGATVHDMFNWLTVLVLLPVEVATGYLFKITSAILDDMIIEEHKEMKVELLSKITKPFTNLIVQLDKNVLEGWALNETEFENATLLLRVCQDKLSKNVTVCSHITSHLPLSDLSIGVILLVISLCLLCFCLITIVKILSSMLKGSIALMVQHVLNADIPYVPWLTGYLAICAGAVMTFLLQSSSIFTSTLTPLVGLGMISVERMYPLTLGSNLGTTTTALLAAMASDSSQLRPALQIALVHLFFNISGMLIFYPVPFMRWPVGMALRLGAVTAQYRWFAIVYMVLMFAVLPITVFVVSMGGPVAMACVFIPVVVLVTFVVVVNLLQEQHPTVLPVGLQTWQWLPLPLRSLAPMDAALTHVCPCCRPRGGTSSLHYAHVIPSALALRTSDQLDFAEPGLDVSEVRLQLTPKGSKPLPAVFVEYFGS